MLKYLGILGLIAGASFLGFVGGKNSAKPNLITTKQNYRAIVFFMKDGKSLWPISPDKEKSFILENAHLIKYRLECY